VSITALSGVGAAFSAGAAAVCAPAPEWKAKTPASIAAAISETVPRPIAISFFRIQAGLLRTIMIADRRLL
jgi:hypothetical protein